jgi:lysophospholipase L1-like esterase
MPNTMISRYLLLTAAIVVLLGCVSGATAQTKPSTQPTMNPNLPTLWLIGDSTVRNGQDTGNNGQWGWGNPIRHYFDETKINIQNKAMGGTSSRTFQRDLWPKILEQIKPGDFLIMQFGHNDAGPLDDDKRARGTIRGNGEEMKEIDNPITKRHEIVHSYGWYLRQFVAQAKEKGAKQVIICSPIPRNAWKDGKVSRNSSYASAAKEAAQQAGVFFIDLNELAATRYDQEGEEKVTQTYFPEKEVVHTDWAGAVLNASCVVDAIKGLAGCDLAAHLRAEAPKDLQPPSGKAR